MIAYQLLTNKEPYFERARNIKNKFKKDVIDGVGPYLSFIQDTEIQSFFKRCWSSELTERPSFSEIYDTIISLKFKSIFQVNELDILKLDFWYKDQLKHSQINESILQKLSYYKYHIFFWIQKNTKSISIYKEQQIKDMKKQ